MSSFNESTGLGYLKTDAIELVKYPSGCNVPSIIDQYLWDWERFKYFQGVLHTSMELFNFSFGNTIMFFSEFSITLHAYVICVSPWFNSIDIICMWRLVYCMSKTIALHPINVV